MKRRFLPGWAFLAAIHLGFTGPIAAQTNIEMPYNSGPLVVTLSPPAACSYTFTDNGAAAGQYSSQSGAGSVVTFMPSSAGNKIVVQFTSFYTETGFDALFVYDGPGTASPQISSGAGVLLGLPNPFSGGTGGWQGAAAPYNVAPNTVRATAANASGALTFAFDSDLTVGKGGWTAIVSEVPDGLCSLQAPGAITVQAPSGNCSADVQTVPPTILPGACSLALELRYRLNDGPAVPVPAPAPPFIVLHNVPVGLNVVSWQLAAPCGGGLAAGVAQLVTVMDKTPPTLVVPANTTFNLGPGECAAPYTYTVEALDNCPVNPASRVDHPVDFNNGAAGILFDVRNLSPTPIVITEFGPVLDPGTWPLEIYVTTAAASWQGVENTPAAWTLAGKRLATSPSAETGTPLTGFSIELAPGESRGIYLTSAQGAPVRCTGTGSGLQRQFDDGILRVSSSPGASIGYPFGQANTSRAYNGYVRCATRRAQAEQIAGLPSGAAFPAGATVNVFRVTDQAGNSATASFSVTVQPYANASSTLICAGIVNASLDADCETALKADDILFGGPYRCLDSYLVQLDKIPPFQDGPWVPALLTSADIGKTYGVRVSDPTTGNLCLGSVLVEDKLPPALNAKTIELPCNFNTAPTYKAPAAMVREFTPAAAALPANVSDFQSLVLNIPAAAPADATVSDVDVQLRINGDVFEKNLRVELENPAGTKVLLWDQATGCSGPLWLRFDDEGLPAIDCGQFNNNKRARIPFTGSLLSAFDGGPVDGIWKLRVRDLNGFSDVATVVEARLIVRYTALFSAGFPNGLVFPGQITQVSPTDFVVPAPLLDGCSNVTLSYSDETNAQPCSTGLTAIVTRTWTARDASNNATSLVQTIRLMRPSFDDVTLPPSFNDADAPAFECGGLYPTPSWIEAQGKQGTPYVFGQPTACSVNWSHTDGVVQVCAGSYTINRTWSVADVCSAQSLQATQQIRVLDRQGPSMNCPANLTVSTDLYTCCATVNLPDVVVEDGCSTIANPRASIVVFNQYSGDTVQVATVTGALTTFTGNNTADPDTLAAFGNTGCLPVGIHQVYYKVEDACGNTKNCSFQLAVRDYTPPVAVGHNLTVVSLNADDLNDCYEPDASGSRFAGVTVVPASTFDQGSYDNCNFVRVTVRRLPPYSACITSLNAVNGAPPCQDGFPDLKSEYARAIAESDTIKFYCCEAGSTQTLALRCYQLDALGKYSLGANGQPIFNETQVQVTVQDKLKPGCQPPADVTVSCENFDPALSNYGLPAREDNCCLDTTKVYQGNPGLTHTLDYAQFDTLCNRGTLVRTFKVFDCQGQTSQCTQRVVVTHDPDYAIRFPDDVVLTQCDSSGIYGQPEFFGQGCASLAVSFQDVVLTVVPDACYAIERTWRVINWCNYVPGATCISVPNPTPVQNINNPANLVGPIVSPPGTAAPWAATSVKISPDAPQATDYSAFWNPVINCYEYKQLIKVIDTQAPVVENCPGASGQIGDQTVNAPDLWNESYWYDASIASHNLPDGPSELSISSTDLCSFSNVDVRYLLFLDLNGDQTMETVISSTNLPGFNKVMYDNAINPNFTGGVARAFDERPVQADQKYGFALQLTQSPKKMTAAVRWNTQEFPDTYVKPELPYGNHKIKWIVSDGCGNEQVCEYAFKVADTKPPTVVCHNGLSVNLLPPCLVTLWASDFLQYGEDNVTPANLLQYGIRKSGTGTGFPTNPDGSPYTSVTFTADELGIQLVELWVRDVAGNASYCETYVDVQNPAGNCDPSFTATVAGTLATEAGDGVEEVNVDLNSSHPALPPLSISNVSDAFGHYELDGLPFAGDYTIAPWKDNDPLNGVSTFDLVLINKHILGLEPLNSPYKMIAADANRSRSLTTFDVVELRKLILGIYNELPNNTSWRFIDEKYSFPNPINPFQEVFPETVNLNNLQTSWQEVDFVAIKTGDVNGNAVTSMAASTDDRSAGALIFDVDPTPPNREGDRKVRAGETFSVRFTAAEKVAGYQFTLYFPQLDIVDVTPGPGMSLNNFGIFNSQHALTTSFDDPEVAGEFTVTFRANAAGWLHDLLAVSGRITKAEAYRMNVVNVGNGVNGVNGGNVVNEKMGVALRFGGADEPVTVGQGFELYQNQPNPWTGSTRIGFYLPEAGSATLTVFDETGRTLFAQKGDFGRGYNAMLLENSALNTTGLLYYKVETATDSAVRKMVRAK